MKKYEKEVQQAYLDSEKQTLKRLEEVYADSLGEINERIEMLLARDDANLQNVIYQADYQRALKKQVEAILDNLQNNEFETVSEYLTESYEDGFIGSLYSMQQQGVPFAFPMDQELIVDAIQHETMLTSSLYTELGLDIKRLQKNIAGEISRGIASSMTYAEIARNVSNYSKMPLNRAMQISRTESHRIRETAVAHSQEKVVAKGADLVRVWDSVMDGKTRSKHLHLDGQKRRVNEPFEIGGKKVMRPGQFGDPADDCNCRCMARCVASWALDADETKRLGNVGKMDDERKKEIAKKLNIPVDELENYSKEIIPINAKDFDDFRKQYKKIWNPDNSERVRSSVQKINDGKALGNTTKNIYNGASLKDTTDKWSKEAKEELLLDERSLSARKKETACVYDGKGKFLFQKRGSENEVQFTISEFRKMKGAVVTHNHPSGASFSSSDIVLLMKSKAAEIRVSTEDCVYYMRQPQKWSNDINSAKKINKERALFSGDVRDKYKKLYKEGKITKVERHRMATDEVNALFCERFGIEYGKEYYND